jgi:hypothetical protein
MNSSDEMRPEAEVTEEWNEECKVVREYMISLWAWARDVKCGDDGWVAPAAPADPNDPTNPAPAAAAPANGAPANGQPATTR